MAGKALPVGSEPPLPPAPRAPRGPRYAAQRGFDLLLASEIRDVIDVRKKKKKTESEKERGK